MSMHARSDSIVEKESSVVVQLGVVPRYLDPHCHEALYEVDEGSMSCVTDRTLR